MNVLRFNRHEIFTPDLLSETRYIINAVEDYEFENGIRDFNFVNELYGLYDGYLYSGLVRRASMYPEEIFERVLTLYSTIHILHTEQQ